MLMKHLKQTVSVTLLLSIFLFAFTPKKEGKSEGDKLKSKKDANGFTYEYVENDPMDVRIYTLDNGLKVYLTVNKDEPRIQTLIPVKAGSTYDPKENTGLAHYLEHMMFKGTEKLGTTNWEKEAPLIALISEKYEEHKATADPDQKRRIYAEIDSISNEASKYAIANEYDKMVSELGAKGTNAFTSNEKTVYVNDIPATELERWIRLERERFGSLVLRLFHTELEAVYEEFNKGQDNDNRKMYFEMLDALYPTHPYGQQTTIGTSEHLKNPSMVNIRKYWETYYVPNNMAICLSGDLDPEQTIQWIDKYWGDLKPGKSFPEHNFPKEAPLTKPVVREVYGPDKEMVSIAFRTGGVSTKEYMMADIVTSMLSNGQAGLFDTELKQKQKVLDPGAYVSGMKEYSSIMMMGSPIEGQSLEETKDLLLTEFEKIKKGEFEDWMLPAIVNNYQLSQMRQLETNYRAYAMMNAFTNEIPWEKEVAYLAEMDKITKQDIVDFTNKLDSYVVVYKRNGKDASVAKVDKPQITPVEVNRDSISAFYADFQNWPTRKLNPVYINYDEEIKRKELKEGVEYAYIQNKSNELAKLIYTIDMGKNHDKKLALAVNYLDFLGTSKYSAEEIQQELYRLGLNMGVSAGSDRSYVYINGLEKNMEKGIELLEHLLADAQPDAQAYEMYVRNLLKKRENNKLNQRSILWGGMNNYARYGENSPYTNVLSEEELMAIDPSELTDKIHDLYNYEHKVFYYGTLSFDAAEKLILKHHNIDHELKPYPTAVEYTPVKNEKSKVYFVNHEMVQAEILLVSNKEVFTPSILPVTNVFNEYFGGGMGSVVFQEIREAKGLAYTSYAAYGTAREKGKEDYVVAYVGTQADKLNDALKELLNLMNNMPVSESKLEQAKSAIQSKLESDRIIKDQIYFNWLSNLDKGIDYDYRRDVYKFAQKASMEEILKFFNDHISESNYSIMVLGNKEMLDIDGLNQFGEVKELSKEEIFGY